MKIPSTIKIGGKVFTVTYPHLFIEREGRSGQSTNWTQRILIANQVNGEPMAREHIEETFIHELIHMVDAVYNGGKLDEETVSRMSEGLYQVLNDAGMLADDPPLLTLQQPFPPGMTLVEPEETL